MSKLKCSEIVDKLNRIKNTCKDQPFDESGLPCINFIDNQIIANGQSRYISIHLNHDLTGSQLSFDHLQQTISKFNPDSEIDLIQDDKQVIIKQRTKGKRVKINLPLVSDRELYYNDNLPDISDMIPLPDDFMQGIKICESSLPKDTSRPGFDCYNIKQDKIIASDGARLSIYKLADELSQSFMLSIKDGISISENIFTHYNFGDGFIDLMGEDIFTRMSFFINDSYPDIDSVDFNIDGRIKIERETLFNDLSRATLFSMGSHTTSSSINFDIDNNKYTIRSENQMGKIIATGKVKHDIELECLINPIFLLQAIEQMNEKYVIINVHNLDDDNGMGKRFMINENNYTFLFSSYNQ